MKLKNKFLTGIILFAAFSIFSCSRINNNQNLELVGSWVMTVTKNNQEKSIFKSNTTFHSLFNGLKYIPNNSEWNFINDSILIVSILNDGGYKSETVFYKVNDSGDSLIIQSKQTAEKYLFKKVNANRFELDFGDKTVSYFLNK